MAALAGRFRVQGRRHLDHRVRGRQGARPRARRGGDRRLGVRRGPARPDRAVPALGELLAGGPDGAVRTLLGALPGPRRRVRLARGPPRRRERALPRVLEPRVHAVQPGSDRDAHAAAEPEHRHRPGPEPHGAHPAGRADDLRDRPVRAAHGPGPRAVAARRARGARAAHPGRPLARDDVPHRRRRRPVQRGPRVHPAPGHAPRDPAGPSHRHRARLHAAVRRRRRGRHGRRVPGARGRARPRQPLGEGGGGGLRPHAGAGHQAARGGHPALA